MIRFRHLFVSPGHNYSGHPGGPPGDCSVIETDPIKFVAGRGMHNARLFGQLPGQCDKTAGTGNDLFVVNFYADLAFGDFGLMAEYLASRNVNTTSALSATFRTTTLNSKLATFYGEAKDTVTGAMAKATTSGIRPQMQIQF